MYPIILNENMWYSLCTEFIIYSFFFIYLIKKKKRLKNLGGSLSSLTGSTRTTVFAVTGSESGNGSSDLDTGEVLKVDSLKKSLKWIHKKALGSCVKVKRS